MVALKMMYVVLLGMWLGSLVTLRYILPAAFSRILMDKKLASEAVRNALGIGNRLGLACGIGMTGSLFLQTLLYGEMFIKAAYIAPLIVIFLLLGATELLYVNNRIGLQPGRAERMSDSSGSPVTEKSLIPSGLRLFLFVQIICAVILFGISI